MSGFASSAKADGFFLCDFRPGFSGRDGVKTAWAVSPSHSPPQLKYLLLFSFISKTSTFHRKSVFWWKRWKKLLFKMSPFKTAIHLGKAAATLASISTISPLPCSLQPPTPIPPCITLTLDLVTKYHDAAFNWTARDHSVSSKTVFPFLNHDDSIPSTRSMWFLSLNSARE